MAVKDDPENWGFVPPEHRTPRQQEFSEKYWAARQRGYTHKQAYDYAYPGARQFFEEPTAPPGTGEQLGLLAAGAGAGAIGTGLGEGLGDWVGGMFTSKPKEKVVKEVLQQVAEQALSQGGSAAGIGEISGIGPVADGSIFADMLGMGGESAAGAGATEGLGSLGAAANLPLAAMAIFAANQLYEHGGKNVLKGKANSRDWANLASSSLLGVLPNAVLGWMGKDSIGEMLSHKSTKQYQQERQQALLDKGVVGYADFVEAMRDQPQRFQEQFADRIKEGKSGFWIRTDLPEDFVGYDSEGNYVNNVLARTGNIADARGEDVWGGEGMFTTFGDKWLGEYTEDQRRAIAQALLERGLVRFDKGDPIVHTRDQDQARSLAADVIGGTYSPNLSYRDPLASALSAPTPGPAPAPTQGFQPPANNIQVPVPTPQPNSMPATTPTLPDSARDLIALLRRSW